LAKDKKPEGEKRVVNELQREGLFRRGRLLQSNERGKMIQSTGGHPGMTDQNGTSQKREGNIKRSIRGRNLSERKGVP